MQKDDRHMHFMGQVTQKALIVRDGKVLLTQYPDENPARRMWDMPGGRLHVGEGVLDGLKREVKEEIGAEIEIERIVGTGTLVNLSNKPNYFVIYECALSTPEQAFVLEAQEVHALAWHDLESLKLIPVIYSEYVPFIEEALRNA